ncbi:MAG: toll/interleukin-1 receptor domain-containing protein [Muribaculaceae bacterium]|nr:toll/interleukin-1 receptor domain-containing protein [Muribaculaceae bacterium]MDE7336143.1 toll/interleukin-1 receptor domain-containing protein [Muribaculaceae bacterium]
MENKLNKVHISYKWSNEYKTVIEAIESGLRANHIPYSMDKYDIMYKGSIDDYEKEIGAANIVIMFVIPEYFYSLDCMFEMTQMFKNGNIKERIFPLVDMKEIPRNGDGLTKIKDFWQNEKTRKSERLPMEPGKSSFLLMEIQKIDEVINTLDDLWLLICRHSTGDFCELVKNDAALLIQELRASLDSVATAINEALIPSPDSQSIPKREILQKGSKSIYIENNTGSIIIN